METIGFSIGLMFGGRTRGRRPDRMAEVDPELQSLLKTYVKGVATTLKVIEFFLNNSYL